MCILVLSYLLVGGFVARIRWLQKSLHSITKTLNSRLSRWSELLDDKDMVEGKAFWTLVYSAFWGLTATLILSQLVEILKL